MEIAVNQISHLSVGQNEPCGLVASPSSGLPHLKSVLTRTRLVFHIRLYGATTSCTYANNPSVGEGT